MKGYSAEAYSGLYDQRIGEQEYAEAVRGRGVKVYRNRSTRAGAVLDLNICAVWNARGEASRAKAAKRAQSPEVIARRNERETARRIEGLINANFGAGDVALYLTFAEAEQDARAALKWYVRTLRREHARQGCADLRYLYMHESSDGDGAPVREHIHIVLSGELGRDRLESIWRERYGIANGTRLQPNENGLSGFAHYIQKAPRKGRRVRRWACSRNLKKPEERRSTRLPDGRTLTKKLVYDLISGKRDAKATLEAAYPGWRFLRMEMRRSEYVSGVYLDIRMTKAPPPVIKTHHPRQRAA